MSRSDILSLNDNATPPRSIKQIQSVNSESAKIVDARHCQINGRSDILSLIDNTTPPISIERMQAVNCESVKIVDTCHCQINGRCDLIDLSKIQFIINIVQGTEFSMNLMLNKPASKVEFYSSAIKKAYEKKDGGWMLSFSKAETAMITIGSYEYVVYADEKYLYRGILNVYNKDYNRTDLSIISDRVDTNEKNILSLTQRVTTLEDTSKKTELRLGEVERQIPQLSLSITNNTQAILSLEDKTDKIAEDVEHIPRIYTGETIMEGQRKDDFFILEETKG